MLSMDTHACDHEESPLLVKDVNLTFYSQRTAETLSTSGSNTSFDRLEDLFIPLHEKKHAPFGDGDGEGLNDHTGNVVVFQVVDNTEQHQPISNDALLLDGTAAMEEYRHVAEVAHEEFQDANETDLHYLEMGLTRNCSILPDDIMDAATAPPPARLPTEDPDDLEGGGVPKKDGDGDAKCDASPPCSAYLLLLSAVVCLAALGPFLELQSDVSSTMKIVWRQGATAMLLFPMAVLDVYRSGMPRLSKEQWVTFLLSTISYDIFSTAFALALNYTSVGNVVILSNSLALILLIGKLCMGNTVTIMEGLGAIVAFGGAALCSHDSGDQNGSQNGLLGDAIAILSALGGVGYLIFAKATRQHMSMYVFMFLTMAVGTFLLVLFQILILGEHVTLDRHENHGVFGFTAMQSDRLPLELCMALVCNCMGTLGYVRSMQHFDNLVISSATLLEPVMAEFMAFGFGVGTLPGLQGWIGNAMVALGTFAVVYQDSVKGGGKSLGH